MAVIMTDGLGRPLYGLSHEDNYTKRRHPHTGEIMPDDYEYPHPQGSLDGGVVFLMIGFVLLIALIFTYC